MPRPPDLDAYGKPIDINHPPDIGPDGLPIDPEADAAQRLQGPANFKTASAEQFTPAARRMTRLEGDPSALGFGENLLRGAVDTVTGIPRMIKGLTKINPAELPGYIVSGIKDRAQSYADDWQSTIYDDPLSFLGDVSTVAGIGAAARAPLQASARQAASTTARFGKAAATGADLGGAAITGAAKNFPILGPMGHGAISSVRQRLGERAARAAARKELGSGRLNTSPTPSRIPDNFDDALLEGLEKIRESTLPTRVGGAGSPLRVKNNLPVVNPELSSGVGPWRAGSGRMVSTQPDKWGASSIHRAEDFIDRSRLVDKARPVVDAPSPVSALPSSTRATMADDAFSRNARGNPQQQELLRALLKQQAEPPIGNLTKAGRSMLTDDDAELFAQALRDMKLNLSHVPRSRTMGRY